MHIYAFVGCFGLRELFGESSTVVVSNLQFSFLFAKVSKVPQSLLSSQSGNSLRELLGEAVEDQLEFSAVVPNLQFIWFS